MVLNNNVVKKPTVKSSKWAGQIDALLCVLTAIVAGGCYLNSLNGDFVHDDIYAIKNNPDVNGQSEWTEIFTNDFWGRPMLDNSSHKSYRPLTVLTFRWDYSLSKGTASWFHIVNVVLHSIVSMLFTYMCRNVFSIPRECSITAGLLFAVHPVHSEAVAGIVGRAELLAAIFFLLALICYVKSIDVKYAYETPDFPVTKHPVLLVAMVICTVAAMLFKEHGVTVIGVCGMLDVAIFCRKGIIRVLSERSEAALMRMSPLMVRCLVLTSTFLCLLIFRIWIMAGELPEFLEQDNPASFSDSLTTRVLTYNYLFAFNSWLLLAPVTLCYDWTLGSIPLVESVADPRNLATLVLFATFIMIGYKCFQDFKSQDDSSPSVTLLALVLLVMPFLPASNLFFRVGFVVAERILYLPSLGFSLLVGYGLMVLLRRCRENRKHLMMALLAYLAILATKTWTQNAVWMSREALFRSGVKTLPDNAKVHYNYGNYLKDIGNSQEAVLHYKKSLQLYPHHASVYNNLGTVVTNQTEAEILYKMALKLLPNHKGAYINLGQLLYNGGQREEGVLMVQKSLDIDAHNIEALLTMGKMMMDEQRWTEAEHYIKTAIVEKPSFAKAYNYYGVFLLRKGQVKDAVSYYQQAYKLDELDTIAMSNAADGLRQLGRLDEAEQLLRHSNSIKPDVKTLDQLAMLYFRSGQMSKAQHVYEELMAQSPNDTDIIIHYANVLMRQNELNKAELYAMRVLSHHPSHLEALRAAANIAGIKRRYKEAVYYLREAVAQAALPLCLTVSAFSPGCILPT
ncbi:protein O-mannosyl-transferase TMTC1-like isoform X2 [Haliotis rufescens]|uniref:protein O-mannosyl-transferase TMTC1-like isoform X2 n=1 Tax=Haliotis rufescens TaxID=6454 RepID=UPI00201F0376|nr:protein O-mannosyl-transferase TMTC1-like isoform X2 [Haliotis rufescens]